MLAAAALRSRVRVDRRRASLGARFLPVNSRFLRMSAQPPNCDLGSLVAAFYHLIAACYKYCFLLRLHLGDD